MQIYMLVNNLQRSIMIIFSLTDTEQRYNSECVCDARCFRGCCLPGETTDVHTWRESGDGALHLAPALRAWTDSCERPQRSAGDFYDPTFMTSVEASYVLTYRMVR